jgi:plastocyanin
LPAGQVEIVDFAFVQPVTTVPKGSTVTWENADATQHTVSDHAGVLSSGILNPGATYSHRFDTPGTYSYFCNFHNFMTGQIVVTG